MFKRTVKGHFTEAAIQKQFVEWIRTNHPNVLFCATVGGVCLKTGPRAGREMKAQGYNPGIPDLIFFEPVPPFKGLMIELKAFGGKPRPTQTEWIQQLNARGYQALVATGLDEAKEVFNNYFKTCPASGDERE